MVVYIGLLYVVLSSFYTFSYAGQVWKENNKLAAIGAVLLVLISYGLAILLFLKTK